MKLIYLAITITLILTGLTALLAWQAHQEAIGAKREVEWFRRQHNEQIAAGAQPIPSLLAGIPSPLEPSASFNAADSTTTTTTDTDDDELDVGLKKALDEQVGAPPKFDAEQGSLPTRKVEVTVNAGDAIPMPEDGSTFPPGTSTPPAAASKDDTTQTEALTAQQRLIMTLPAIATVKQAFTSDGFVLIDAGKNKGLEKGMTFDVRRGNSRVGRIVLTDSIEEDEAIADIQPRFMIAGLEVRSGDELVQVTQEP
jgi:hypothetical protein